MTHRTGSDSAPDTALRTAPPAVSYGPIACGTEPVLPAAEREAAIVAEGEALRAAIARWDKHGCFDDHALAESHQRRMYALIAQRPADWRPTAKPWEARRR